MKWNRKPSLISLFTGAGGLDIGLESAGFSTVAAVDSDADCINTLRLNQNRHSGHHKFLQEANILHARIEDIEPAHLKPKTVDRHWVPDLLAGGPPCQPFSSAGNMLGFNDPRGRLFEHFVRIADGLRPRLILFENVRGLVTARGPSGEPGEALELVKKAFESIGYSLRFSLLNSADFGAPQRRVRMFMLATNCTVLPLFPFPTHYGGPTPLLGVRPWVSLGECLANLPPATDEEIELPSETLTKKLATVSPGSGLKSPGAREATRPGGHWGYKQGTFVVDPKKPARTVTASTAQDWIWDSQGRLRRLTWRECSAIQGFPAEWEFYGNKASCYRQIGNAVPSIFGRVLGEKLLGALEQSAHGKLESAPLPHEFKIAIHYTKKEHSRNGPSRHAVRAAIANGSSARRLKGLGSAV
jgi:DNA (cytosine-5)-methyltransferase 1